MEDIFNKLVEEFGLSVSVDREGEKYAKFPGIGGFLIALVPSKAYLMVTKSIEQDDTGYVFFFGANGYNNYTDARAAVADMVLRAKEFNVNKKIQNIQKDFKCKRNLT
jgi:hypothetical protein